jgi:hypothetical protein
LTISSVVLITVRISMSNARNGTNSAQALVHSRTIAGYQASQAAEKSAKRSSAACSVGAV